MGRVEGTAEGRRNVIFTVTKDSAKDKQSCGVYVDRATREGYGSFDAMC